MSPHRLRVASEGDGRILDLDASRPRPCHGGSPKVVQLELETFGVLLEVELSLVLKPVLQSLRAIAADTLGVVGTATVEVDCPKLFRERLKDVFSPRQSFQFAEDGSR